MLADKSIIAIIPARGGSKGVYRKNIATINGKPLIYWTISEAQKSIYIDYLMVSTEDEEICKIASTYGADIPFLRPKELAEDDTSSEAVIVDVIKKLEKQERFFDYILLLQPTSPLRTANQIDEAIEQLLNRHPNNSALISVMELENPPHWNRRINEKGELEKFIEYDKKAQYRRQDFDKIYRLNGAIYLINRAAFMSGKTFEPADSIAYEMDYLTSVDIDSDNDVKLAEYLFSLRA